LTTDNARVFKPKKFFILYFVRGFLIMRSEGKIFLIAILVMALITSLAAAMLTDGHVAEAKSKQKIKKHNHCKIKNKNSHHSNGNDNISVRICSASDVNLKNVIIID
jgi:hypothetical protein